MKQNVREPFEEVFKIHERQIYYLIRKLNIDDSHQEFYQEGLYAMWEAVQTFQPGKSQLSTHLHNTIRNRLVDLMRIKKRRQRHDSIYCKAEMQKLGSGNHYRDTDIPIQEELAVTIHETDLWEELKPLLTTNQRKWVKYYIFMDMSNREIAEQEHVSIDAVKSWAKMAKQKLKRKGLERDWPEIK
ncbi:RNA polymerase sigma factor [Lentibacillus daqui]|uniref:RNA polymerase sigma factor n=1 Tax=Lentibacillus daqui TaxID=2911514 RepID=UPI0022B194E6|nr:sigma-70 family RNA polymerase sigma factor [Lentibacillus daqui]